MVIGASTTPGKIGHEVFRSLLQNGFKGEIIPVNPFREEILGVKTIKEMSALDKTIDLAVQVVDFRKTPELVKKAWEKGAKAYIVISGGGKETGIDEVTKIEKETSILASKLGISVLGPNCVGVFSGKSRIDTFFHPIERMLRPEDGNLAVLAQSGTYGVSILEEAARLGIGISKFISYGNKLDIDESDMLEYLTNDEATKVIILYLEALGESTGRKFFNVVVNLTKKKPLLLIKSCKTQESATASLSHTGWFGGSWDVMKGVLKQSGAIVVDSIDGALVATKALQSQPLPKGNRIAMVSNGAGPMLTALDHFPSQDLLLAPLSQHSLKRMNEQFPPFFSCVNPVDVTGSATDEDYAFTLLLFQDDPNVDIIMPWFVMQDSPLAHGNVLIDALMEVSQKKPIIGGAMGAIFTEEKIQELERETGIPFAKTVDSWVVAAFALYQHAKTVIT
ncbi:MAG: CoA-binding protein [Promethearchaeota archaeon]